MPRQPKKNLPIDKEQATAAEIPLHKPSEKELQVVRSTFDKFRRSADDRNRSFEYFDGLDLISYIEDSVRRFTTNIDERDDIEDWQARIHDPFTRNKVLAILGKVVQVLPISQFSARGEEDCRKASISNSLYEYSEDVDDYEELMTHVLLESIVKGTAIGYEGMERKERMVRNIKKTGDDITFEEGKEINTRLFGSVVKLEDFYPQHVGFRTIKQMDYCFWRDSVPYQKFIADWGNYERSMYVQAQAGPIEGVEQPYYAEFISPDVSDGEVEIIRYYNKDTDEYVILANGIWLNPIFIDKEGEERKEIVSPLPWNHKQLPFWDIRFDFFGSDFFYGKSLPDRLKALQDVLNVLSNMLLDQSFLTIFPPLLTNGFDSIEDDYLRPGRRTPIDTQGLKITDAFMKLDLGTPSGWHQYILEYTRKIMEQSSLDQVSSGQAGVGGRTTAQEIRLAADGVASMLGLFARMVHYGIKRKAILRMGNILQFWTDPETPMFEKVLGTGGTKDAKEAFATYKVDNTVLTDGKRGMKIIELYSDKDNRPTKKQLQARAAIYKKDSGKEIEILAVEPQYIRDFQFDVIVGQDARKSTTKDIEKALQLEKVRVYLSFFPDLVDKQELAAQTAEKMGDDPTKILKSEIFNPPEPKPENPEAENPLSTEPQGAEANNMVRGMEGGEGDAMAMRDLAASMGS